MISAYLVTSRITDDDEVSRWFCEPELSVTEEQDLYGTEVLFEDWGKRRAFMKPSDAVMTDVQWFGAGFLLMLPAEGGDPVMRELLSLEAEWLPLTGEANGWLLHHPLHRTELNENLCERRPSRLERFPGPVLKWSFDKSTIRPGIAVQIIGLGLVWFVDDKIGNEGNDLRSRVHEEGITGIGFIKVWDDSETYRLDPKWRRNMVRGDDVWA